MLKRFLAPTEAMLAGFPESCSRLARTLARWKQLDDGELKSLNAALVSAGGKGIAPAAGVPAPKC